jgi:HAD superfamily hydrolase (TIGR01490 family)
MKEKEFNLPSIAFFDVDETLINSKSMFSFLKFHLIKTHPLSGNTRFNIIWKLVKIMALIGVKRENINRLYYRIYAGESYEHLQKLGLEWYETVSADNDFYLTNTVSRLNELKNTGVYIVLVSGSFRPCLEPIAAHLGADEILCGELEIMNDQITGKMTQQAIGHHKSLLSQKMMLELGVLPKNCYAFGDHISDLDLLNSVGNPVVIKNCEALFKQAKKNHWEIIL